MKVALDTSVVVAGLVRTHPHFSRAFPWLEGMDRGVVEICWATHAYAECWSVLTRLPLAQRLDAAVVQRILDGLADIQAPAPMSFEDYRAAATRCASAGLRSGAIFDALHLVVAERLHADALLTFNLADFTRLAPQLPVLAPDGTLRI